MESKSSLPGGKKAPKPAGMQQASKQPNAAAKAPVKKAPANKASAKPALAAKVAAKQAPVKPVLAAKVAAKKASAKKSKPVITANVYASPSAAAFD